MADSLPLRIFLASPGDLEAERGVVRACVDEQNARRQGESNVVFEVVGWERVRGTARRPQEAVNELIGECHFLVVLFKKSWGSEPGSPWGYTAGTEEELFEGLLELGRPEQPMRDVWVAFLDDPDPANEITMLRDQMSRNSSLMYESVADAVELKERLTKRLDGWEASAGTKVPRQVDLMPSSGKEVLRAANLRLRGEKLIELGQAEAGSSALHEAAALGGPVEQLAYARFLARHGELEGAHEWTQRAIDHFTDGTSHLYSPLAADAFAAQAGVLRRQGHYNDAIGRFQQALTLLEENDPYAQKVRCRIFDELGLAHNGVNDLESARSAFEESLESRRTSGDDVGVCQSLVNLARLEVRAANLETARAHADEVLEGLRGIPPTSLHANALLLAAQLRLRQGSPDQGIPYAEQALSLNQQMASRHGEARSLVVLAQCCREVGRKDDAARHARGCLEVNKAMGSDYGVQRAQWILDNLSA